MATATYDVGLVRVQGEQLSLSNALASLGMPPGYHQVRLYAPSVAFRLHLNPAITEARFYDASAAAGARFIAEHAVLTDRATGTGTGTAMDASTTSDFLYLCFSNPVGGVRITIGNANAVVAALAGSYSKNDKTWSALTIGADGTASGGKTLAQTGSVTITVPTDWGYMTLLDLGITDRDAPSAGGFWARFSWNATLTDPTSITEVWTLNADANRGYYLAATAYPLSLDRRMVGAIEAILAAGTDTLDVTWMRTVR